MHDKSYKDAAGKILIGSTFIKAFSDETACPKKLVALYIDQSHKSKTTEAMLRGLYFEQNVLGKTSSSDEQPIQLELLKSGKKSTDHERIDMQMNVFKQVIDAYKITIADVQVPVYYDLNEHYRLGTVSDIVGSIDDSQHGFVEHAIFDVKLTENIKSAFGDFQWGEPEKRDHTQAVLSVIAYHAVHGVYPKFYYLVFGYNTAMGYDVIEKIVTGIDIVEFQEKIRLIFEYMLQMDKLKWPTNPSFEQCKNCPLLAECNQQISLKPITRV